MKKGILGGLAFVVALAFAPFANAATFDFAGYADGSYGEGAWSDFTVTENGTTVTATANDDNYAYLDRKFEGRPSGLGVCQNLLGAGDVSSSAGGDMTSGDNCDPSSDDNVTTGEAITLTFDDFVFISVYLKDTLHTTDEFGAGDKIDVSIDGGAFVAFDVSGASILGLSGTSFTFRNNNQQFYINSVTTSVPEPSALGLIGLGLVGMGYAYRRRKKAA